VVDKLDKENNLSDKDGLLKINLQVDFVGDIDLGFSIIYIFLIS
jgi:hypothetical protein